MPRKYSLERRWSAEQLAFLKANWIWLPVSEIQKTIPRSSQALINKACRDLGLKTDREAAWKDNWKFIAENPYESLSDTERAYIAGIVDGEGTIQKDNGGRRFWMLTIGNTDKNLIDWLHKKVPYSRVTTNKLRFHWKQSWRWALVSNIKVLRLLQLIRPFMVVKAERADEAIDGIMPTWRRLNGLRPSASPSDAVIG